MACFFGRKNNFQISKMKHTKLLEIIKQFLIDIFSVKLTQL